MYFHVITSTSCNLKCRYCYAKSCDDFGNNLNEKFKFDFSIPPAITYSVRDLKKFLKKSDNQHTLTFYGGEPLLQIDKITEIMDNINARYMIQTNGLLLDKLPKEYTNRFKVILVSLDGNKRITDFNRGDGTYDKVMNNIKLIKQNGFTGELIARMVVDENSSLLEDVKHLFTAGFDAVHWQLDAGFYKNDYENRNFKDFVSRYNKEVKELADFWVDEIREGNVLRIYPFLGIFESLYHNKKENLRCGSGHSNYTIATNGKISVCPIMHDATAFQAGDIWKSSPENLKKIFVDEPCASCDILDLCGGRCLYANYAKLWPREGQALICNTIRNLIEAIREKIPEIKELIRKGIVQEDDFFYEKYNGAEIIP
jgi:putative peptide-modifying radical SAM enzyme